MKNLLLSLAVVATTASFGASSSESYSSKKIGLGVQAGMTFSTLSTPSDVVPSNRSGLAAGITYELPISSSFAIMPELMFVQKGADLIKTGNLKFTAVYNSLEIPVFAKIKVGESIAPFLIAGPVAILNISDSVQAEAGGSTTALNFKPNTFDLGVAVGGGIDVGPIFATLRYTVGVTELNQNSAEWKSRGFQLLAGARL